MKSQRVLMLGLLLALALAIVGCTFVSENLYQSEGLVEQTFSTSDAPTIVVETFNGQILASVGSGNQVVAQVSTRAGGNTQAEADRHLEEIDLTLTQEGDTVRVIAKQGDPRGTYLEAAEVTISVPAGATLDMSTSNGRITVGDVQGDLNLSTSNGAVSVENGMGRITISDSNGRIDISAENAVVDAGTSNGEIAFTGSLAAGNHSFRSSNGAISIALPAGASFNIDAETSNGSVTSDFPVEVSGTMDDDQLRGSVGEDSGVNITVRTSNGRITIEQR